MAAIFGTLPWQPIDPRVATGLKPLGLDKAGPKGLVTPKSALTDQFCIFALRDGGEGSLDIVDIHDIEPTLGDSPEQPDIEAKFELVTFHAPPELLERQLTGATLRMDVGQAAASSGALRPLYWSIAAGLDLYNQLKTPDQPSDLRCDFASPLQHQPIALPGGVGELRFELAAHKPETWWRKLFQFGSSDTVKALTSAIGFPGILPEAMGLINEAFRNFGDDAETLMVSRPLRLAFSKPAKDELSGGLSGIHVAVLNPGYCLLARSRDFDLMQRSRAKFYSGLNVLLPGDMDIAGYHGGEVNPFDALPYALIKVRARQRAFTML